MLENFTWPLERIIVLFISFTFLFVGIQVTMFHYRQNFHKWVMWGPVIYSPIMFVIAGAYAFILSDWLFWLYLIMLVIGLVDGLIGFIYHFHGVGLRVDGYKLRNFLIGPPIILPLLFVVLSTLGLVALI